MKKIVVALMSLLMTFSLCACGTGSLQSMFSKNSTEEAEKPTTKTNEEDFKIGILCPHDETALDTINQIEAIRKTQYAKSMKDDQVVIKTAVTKEKVEECLGDLASTGCDLILSTSYEFEDAVVKLAGDHPEIEFCQLAGDQAKTSGLSNMHNYYSRIYEAYYVAGVVAGAKLNDMLNKGEVSRYDCLVGFVADKENTENTSAFTAFSLGIKSVCSQAKMYVRYVEGDGTYDDDYKAAKQLIQAGAVLIAQHTYSTAVAYACEEAGRFFVGNDANLISTALKKSLVSVTTDWSVYYTDCVDKIENSEDIKEDWCGGYSQNVVGLTKLNDAHVADGTNDKVIAVEEAMRNGEVKVFDTERFTINSSYLTTLIENDSSYTDYGKYVEGGEFKESYNRSKPRFDLMIDGIEVSTYDYLADLVPATTEEEE